MSAFPFEIIKSIPLWSLSFCYPDKSKIPFAQFHDTVNRPNPAHVCVGNNSIQHNWTATRFFPYLNSRPEVLKNLVPPLLFQGTVWIVVG